MLSLLKLGLSEYAEKNTFLGLGNTRHLYEKKEPTLGSSGAKIDFLISASKLDNTNISLALLRRLRSNTLRCTLLCPTENLENEAFLC